MGRETCVLSHMDRSRLYFRDLIVGQCPMVLLLLLPIVGERGVEWVEEGK